MVSTRHESQKLYYLSKIHRNMLVSVRYTFGGMYYEKI